ncbi:hypothetical protein DL96DRAFT_1590373 [Flagelloscypha sp. PMI_526]|nr:hypothetical protein DL96DRAFT_1590373 [Flagelloscypha sp. PMI_526]
MNFQISLPLIRTCVFGIVLVFSLIVLGLSAHIISLTTNDLQLVFGFGFYFVFSAMGIAVGLLTLISLGVMLAFGIMNKESMPVLVIFELICLSILWVLWLSTAALAATAFLGTFGALCGFINPSVDSACRETQAVVAFSFLTWIALFGYIANLLIFAIIAAARGNKNSFKGSVLTTNFLAPGPEKPNGALAPQPTGQSQISYFQAPGQGMQGYPPSSPPQMMYPQPMDPGPPNAAPLTPIPPQLSGFSSHSQYPPGAATPYTTTPHQHPGFPQV